MKLLFTALIASIISINASDLHSIILKPTIQSGVLNLRRDLANNTIVAHYHFKHADGFYDTIVTRSLQDSSLTIKNYRSTLKDDVIVPELTETNKQEIMSLLIKHIETLIK